MTEHLKLADVAEVAGVTVSSIRTYHKRATANRRANDARPGDLPAPDGMEGSSPVWSRSTVDEWLATRPGKGVGGGRPWWKERAPG